jgi:hypothetical protein
MSLVPAVVRVCCLGSGVLVHFGRCVVGVVALLEVSVPVGVCGVFVEVCTCRCCGCCVCLVVQLLVSVYVVSCGCSLYPISVVVVS